MLGVGGGADGEGFVQREALGGGVVDAVEDDVDEALGDDVAVVRSGGVGGGPAGEQGKQEEDPERHGREESPGFPGWSRAIDGERAAGGWLIWRGSGVCGQ